MDEIIDEFLVESYENLDRLDLELVELEESPTSEPLLASIFRNVHTIKGTSGFFGFGHLESVSHAGENLLSGLRSGELSFSTEIADALLATVDAVRSIVDVIQATRSDGVEEYAELVATLHRLADPSPSPVTESPDSEIAPTHLTESLDVAEIAPVAEPEVIEAEAEVATSAAVSVGPAAAGVVDGGDQLVVSVVDSTIRVDVSLLDRLMNLVGELVLARNQVLQYHAESGDAGLQTTSQQLNLITTELQAGVMKTRMQPIGNVWSKLPRVVRDLAASCKKVVRLEMVGEETELDKTLIEAIKDPLTHIVRNCVDHGLELPAVRVAAGKPECGVLRLRAFHEGGQVIIEITDDGGGLNLDRIRAKAVSSGVLTAERVAQLNDREVANLIFRPGFSTAEQVTNVSGRGVGMDVVKTNVEKIGGNLEIASRSGEGTTLTIKIPLTLAIIPALVVVSDGDRYLLPQINLVEVLHLDGSSAETKIEMAGDAPLLRLRGNLLPIVHLRDVLAIERDVDVALDSGVSIVVLHADGYQFGLVVDQISDTEEIVVKPLSPHLKNLGAYSGTTIMGDGAVALILDTIGIARLSGVLRAREGGGESVEQQLVADERRDATQMVLVCTVGTHRIGIPLALVSRLEELPSVEVERASGRDVIQYRNGLLNLIHLHDVLEPGLARPDDVELLQVLVHDGERGTHGLVVDEIVDIFETDLADAHPADHAGLSLSGVIGRRVTDLLDIDEIIALAGPRHATTGAPTSGPVT